MTYSLTYKFEELPVADLLVRGSAEIDFWRDATWKIRSITINDAFDPEGDDAPHPSEAEVKVALHRESRRIQRAVNDELAELPSEQDEAEADAADYWRKG